MMKISLHVVFCLNAGACGISQVFYHSLINHPDLYFIPEEANQQDTCGDERLNFLADLDLGEKVLICDALNRLVHCIHIR
jgi:hypothetical protein